MNGRRWMCVFLGARNSGRARFDDPRAPSECLERIPDRAISLLLAAWDSVTDEEILHALDKLRNASASSSGSSSLYPLLFRSLTRSAQFCDGAGWKFLVSGARFVLTTSALASIFCMCIISHRGCAGSDPESESFLTLSKVVEPVTSRGCLWGFRSE
jgi:hypothetical protein